MNKHHSETLERVQEVITALQKALLPLCIMLEHTPVPTHSRTEISFAFAEAKAALWGLADALHDGAKAIRREEEHDERGAV